MYELCGWKVQKRDWKCRMHELSRERKFAYLKLRHHCMCLQCRVLRPEWHGMYCMRDCYIQKYNWNCAVCLLSAELGGFLQRMQHVAQLYMQHWFLWQ
jgi:hypothetical protein